MKLRENDPDYMSHVTRWFNQMLPRVRPFLYENDGPVVMMQARVSCVRVRACVCVCASALRHAERQRLHTCECTRESRPSARRATASPPTHTHGTHARNQIENEYGFCGIHDVPYLRALISIARANLGDKLILFTVDPPSKIDQGTISGDEVFSCVRLWGLRVCGSRWADALWIATRGVLLQLPLPHAVHTRTRAHALAHTRTQIHTHTHTHTHHTRRSAVDFGAGWWSLKDAFGKQASKNAPGMSPPFNAEF